MKIVEGQHSEWVDWSSDSRVQFAGFESYRTRIGSAASRGALLKRGVDFKIEHIRKYL